MRKHSPLRRLEAELRDAHEGQGTDADFGTWLQAMADDNDGTLQNAARELLAHIARLRDVVTSDEISEDHGARAQRDEDGAVIVSMATCGRCGLSWNNALISSRTPAPGARCPYESIHDEIAELARLTRPWS